MTDREKKIAEAALSQVGSPYVYGAWGGECTPALRRKYARCTGREAIRKSCPVLRGSQTHCERCQNKGKLAFDCRGFTHWAMAQGGVSLAGQGATSQWNTRANWVEKGTVAGGVPEGLCCLLTGCLAREKSGSFMREVVLRDGTFRRTGSLYGGGRGQREVLYPNITVQQCGEHTPRCS